MTNSIPRSTTISPVQAFLENLHLRFADDPSGEVASYIPELAKADPRWFGIVIATVDGQVYEVGDSRRPFTIQSVSKPLAYGVALEDHGRERVLAAIGVEPTGDAFNSISLEPDTGRPLNPMINAGAIATASLISGDTPEARLKRLLDALSAYAGRPLGIDDAVFQSERSTGHRNRAIGHMLRNYDILVDDPEQALELYFKQCSVLVDCRDLALIAATLANAGVNPVTGARAVRSEYIDSMLSVMTTCGMYDFTGEWIYRVGLPAKSGVGGGIVAVLPGQLGIGVFSPPLDERGNSVRGVQACEALSRELGLHFLQPPRVASATLRTRYDLSAVRSKRRRSAAENTVLREHGHRAVVYELQGDLRFSTIEPILRNVVDAGDTLRFAVLDFRGVTHADTAAVHMLAGLVACCAGRGQQLVLTRVRRGELLSSFDGELDPHHARAVVFQPQLDLGLEWCERGLLALFAQPMSAVVSRVELVAHQLCAEMDAEELMQLEACADTVSFDAGATIVRRGDRADGLYLLMRGQVSVIVDLPGGGQRRLSTLSAGMGFGENALVTGGIRSADVRADTPVECRVLRAEVFAVLQRQSPGLMVRLLHNMLRNSADTTARLTAEVAALER